jgi:hypothetical protein
MRCIDAGHGQRPSLLADGQELAFDAVERRELARSVWRVRSGLGSFLASTVLYPLKGHPGRATDALWLRYDAGCMTLADPSFSAGATTLREALERLVPQLVEWEPDLTLVIDNWRMLHGRGTTKVCDAGSRRLQRILVALSD